MHNTLNNNKNMMDFPNNNNNNNDNSSNKLQFHGNKRSRARRQLSASFQPGPHDVLCSKGKQAYNHQGNRTFRDLVKFHQRSYDAVSNCKYLKSKIVSNIVATIRNSSPNGGFVKNINGVWYEVGDRAAKEKVGQAFRDLLHTKYSSSTKSKAKIRQWKRMKEYVGVAAELAPFSSPVNNNSGSGSSASIVSAESSTAAAADDDEDEAYEAMSVPSVIEVMSTTANNATAAAVEPPPSSLSPLGGITVFGNHHFYPTDETYDRDTFPVIPIPPVADWQFGMENKLEDTLEDDMKRDFCEAMGVVFES